MKDLVTPVIRNADKLSLKEISATVKDLAKRARDKKLKPEEYAGGTITLSTLGAYGIEQFFAIINPPQAAILAVGAIVKKPVVNAKGEIVVGRAHERFAERRSPRRRRSRRSRISRNPAQIDREPCPDAVLTGPIAAVLTSWTVNSWNRRGRAAGHF